MDLIFSILMMVFAVIIVIVILLQTRGSSAGLFGQSDGSFRSRRGIEQILFRLTILLIVVFVGIAVLNVRF
ncbi:MAG: preprotein translocase subunit SecG [Chloroflexi bacterium]|nr:preprotein translocase subunit SecG [Chloroflexota bacterium]